MAPKGSFLSVLLLFSVLFLVSWGHKNLGSYQNFLRVHVDARRTILSPQIYCQTEMKARGLTSPTCDDDHTFIHASSIRVKNICGVGGTHYGDHFSDSLTTYFITTCSYTRGTPPHHCEYTGLSQRRRLRVICKWQVPVWLVGILYTWPPEDAILVDLETFTFWVGLPGSRSKDF